MKQIIISAMIMITIITATGIIASSKTGQAVPEIKGKTITYDSLYLETIDKLDSIKIKLDSLEQLKDLDIKIKLLNNRVRSIEDDLNAMF